MPFLTLKRLVIDDGWGPPSTHCYLLIDDAVDRMTLELKRLKDAGAKFDENAGPHSWFGFLHNGTRVSVELIDEPFADNARIHASELTIYRL